MTQANVQTTTRRGTDVRTGICKPREPAVDLVRIISEGTYTSFAQALKEFVSNAYDADATRVDIRVDNEANAIAIRDDGEGMTLGEFRDVFASIARSGTPQRGRGRGRTESGRRRIGRFGIGSLAVIGAADRFTVRSVKSLTGEGFEATIDLHEFRNHFDKGEDLSRYWAFPYTQWKGEPRQTHFTEIEIGDLQPDVQGILRRPGEKTSDEFFESTQQLSGLDELAWQLGVICPVPYAESYPVAAAQLEKKRDALLLRSGRELLRARFTVSLNGRPVRRPISLPSYKPRKGRPAVGSSLLGERALGFDIVHLRPPRDPLVHYEGYIVVQGAEVFPRELQGLLVRLRGVAVGWHRSFNLASAVMSTMAPAMSGEVWVDGLDDALQFDRESFREDHPAFRWFREHIEQILPEQERQYRLRSAERSARERSKGNQDKGAKDAKSKEKAGAESKGASEKGAESTQSSTASDSKSGTKQPGTEAFIPMSIFDGQREYVTRLVPQINGCWDRDYRDACAVMVRRLVETLIIEAYRRRGLDAELVDDAGVHLGLKRLVAKICGDRRFGVDKKCGEWLKELKDLGDAAAHDFRIALRRDDLSSARRALRFASERLIFEIKNAR